MAKKPTSKPSAKAKESVQGRPKAVAQAMTSNKTKTKAIPLAAAPASTKPKPTPAKPKLLSGGNPQIPKGDGDAPVQAYIAAVPGWQQAVAVRLDALIERAVPGVIKAVRWNSPFYGVEGKGWFLSFHIFTRYVKVTFFAGSSLKPPPAGASKYPAVRYADLHEGQLDERQLTSWVKQAAKLPGWSP